MNCDFCHDENCVKCYPHGNIKPPTIPMFFQAGEWASCRECAELHEAMKIEELLERALHSPANIDWFANVCAQGKGDAVREGFKYVYERISRVGRYIEC